MIHAANAQGLLHPAAQRSPSPEKSLIRVPCVQPKRSAQSKYSSVEFILANRLREKHGQDGLGLHDLIDRATARVMKSRLSPSRLSRGSPRDIQVHRSPEAGFKSCGEIPEAAEIWLPRRSTGE